MSPEFGLALFAGVVIGVVAHGRYQRGMVPYRSYLRALGRAASAEARADELLAANTAYLARARAERARADRLENAVLSAGFRSLSDDTRIARTSHTGAAKAVRGDAA